VKRLFLLGQRVNETVRMVEPPVDAARGRANPELPLSRSLLKVDGAPVVTSVQRQGDGLAVRLFNPLDTVEKAKITPSFKASKASSRTLDGRDDSKSTVVVRGGAVDVQVPPKRIATVVIEK
jgi:alpha-mannosidase